MKVIYIYFIHIIGIDNMFFHASAKLFFYLGKDCFDLQPSWFDTLSKNAGCLQVGNVPVKAKDLEDHEECETEFKGVH